MNFIIGPGLLLSRGLPGCGRLVVGVILRILRKWLDLYPVASIQKRNK